MLGKFLICDHGRLKICVTVLGCESALVRALVLSSNRLTPCTSTGQVAHGMPRIDLGVRDSMQYGCLLISTLGVTSGGAGSVDDPFALAMLADATAAPNGTPCAVVNR